MSYKIIILGSKGMLGQMVNAYFSSYNYEVVTYDKRFNEESISSYVNEINDFSPSVVINCIGKIKQKSDIPYDLFLSNSLFPLELNRSLDSKHLLIHPSTDCVFDGNTKAKYKVFDKHTASDIYGISKSLGEAAILGRKNSLIIRTSIIGPDKLSKSGLLSWFLNTEKNTLLKGYENHLWNGVTTLEWCNRLNDFLQNPDKFNHVLDKRIIQLGTFNEYSKYDMLIIFNSVFQKKHKIIKHCEVNSINRCLEPYFSSPNLETQVEELERFMKQYNFI